jgi:hypothetical protein
MSEDVGFNIDREGGVPTKADWCRVEIVPPDTEYLKGNFWRCGQRHGSLEAGRSGCFFYSQRQTGFSRSSGAGSCGMSGNRTQRGWLAVNPQMVPSSHSAKNPLEAVLIWMILLTPRHPRPVISQAPCERRWPLRPPSQLSA